MINYLAGDWHYFSGEVPVVERPPPVALKKADFIRDLGPAITSSPETLKLILGELGPITEEEVMDCILVMCEERISVDSGV